MSTIFHSRILHGECHVSRLPSGLDIAWETLSLGDFVKYDLELRAGRIPSAIIEDEIFKKCVISSGVKLNINSLDAGIVTTVVSQIMEYSGPSGPEQIANDLNNARYMVGDFLNDSVAIILQTFPGYTADKLYDLPYLEFLKILMMAERRLIATGLLQEPIQPVLLEGEDSPASQQQQFKDLNPEEKAPVLDPYHPPIPRQQPKRNKDLVVSDGADGQMFHVPDGMTGIDLEVYMKMNGDKWRQDALEGLEHIYPELMSKLKAGEEITPETVRSTRGATPEEVRAKNKEYTKNILDGKIKHEPSKPLIAWEQGEGAKPKAKRSKE